MTLNYGDYGIFLIMGNAGFISLNPNPPIDRLKEPLKGTLIDPFKGTPGFCIINRMACAMKCASSELERCCFTAPAFGVKAAQGS